MGGHRSHYGQRASSIFIADIIEVGGPRIALSCPLDRILTLHLSSLIGLLHNGLHAKALEWIVQDIQVGRQRRGMYVAHNGWGVLKI